jgi:hypothetical protein
MQALKATKGWRRSPAFSEKPGFFSDRDFWTGA